MLLRSPTVVVTGLSTKMVWNQSLMYERVCRNVTWHGGCWKSGSHHGAGSGRSLLIQYFTCCRYELRAAKRRSWQRTDAIVRGEPGRFKCFSSSVFWVWSTGESINMVGGETDSIVGEIYQRGKRERDKGRKIYRCKWIDFVKVEICQLSYDMCECLLHHKKKGFQFSKHVKTGQGHLYFLFVV